MTTRQFQTKVLRWYARHGRHDLPWRKNHDPYRIVVSEFMLQQTQVDRVREKYVQFVRTFPTTRALARASGKSVLRAWQGLGYNRRALYLKRAAETVIAAHGGRWPKTTHELESLPGIGPYTARAIAVFAFNLPEVVIETNIRRVFLHEFFPRSRRVSDARLTPYITKTLYRANPRRWYSALMDFGSTALKHVENPNRRSKHYARQAPFLGSNREVRGAVIRLLTERSRLRTEDFVRLSSFSLSRINPALASLEREGLIIQHKNLFSLAL